MIRMLNFTLVLMTGLISLGVYRVAEEARIAAVELRETRTEIAQENQSMAVLGAEWARLTQPARIQALADRYLKMDEHPAAQLASITDLPSKFAPQPEDAIRAASAVVPQSSASQPLIRAAVTSARGGSAASNPSAQHTGT